MLSLLDTGSCTCPIYMKDYICKHLIGIVIFTKRLLVPNSCKAIHLGHNRKKGRTVLAVRSISRQNVFTSLSAAAERIDFDIQNYFDQDLVKPRQICYSLRITEVY